MINSIRRTIRQWLCNHEFIWELGAGAWKYPPQPVIFKKFKSHPGSDELYQALSLEFTAHKYCRKCLKHLEDKPFEISTWFQHQETKRRLGYYLEPYRKDIKK